MSESRQKVTKVISHAKKEPGVCVHFKQEEKVPTSLQGNEDPNIVGICKI